MILSSYRVYFTHSINGLAPFYIYKTNYFKNEFQEFNINFYVKFLCSRSGYRPKEEKAQ